MSIITGLTKNLSFPKFLRIKPKVSENKTEEFARGFFNPKGEETYCHFDKNGALVSYDPNATPSQ